MERNRYADLLRVVAIGAVVYGHWLLTDVTYHNGQLSGLDALEYVSWGRWVTWLFQVMPFFFLVGGYVDAQSWTLRRARGETWTEFVRDRAMRLLWPTAAYVLVAVLAVIVARAAGSGPAELAKAGWLIALQLWFLPVYLLLIALTPVLLACYRRYGLVMLMAMAVGAAAVDALVLGSHVHVIGYANFLLVWGSMYVWGFGWQDGTLTRPRWRPYAMSAVGIIALAALLTWGPFPVDMIGAGERITNTSPPSIALLAFAAAQCGLVLAAAPVMSRLLRRSRLWLLVTRVNKTVMTVYLWHMMPVIVIAVAFYPTGILPQPVIGTGQWWLLRLVWWALLTLVLVPLIEFVMWAERPMKRFPTGIGKTRFWSPLLLALGLAASMTGLTKLAIGGFAPDGRPPGLVLAALAVGMAAILFTGRASPEAAEVAPTREKNPDAPPAA